jgi:glycosyltransferase involved in cell wall biosynthesis
MVIAFENHFERHYEGGARWLHDVLSALGTVVDPPLCLVIGARPANLPADLRVAGHVRAHPWRHAPQPRTVEAEIDVVLDRTQAELWVGRQWLPRLASGIPRVICWPDFNFRHLEHLDDAEVERVEERWQGVAEAAEAVMMISQTAADEALASTPTVGERLFVCGYPPVFSESALAQDPDAVRRRYHLPERFLVVCNQFWLHKNHAVVVNALSELAQRGETPPVVAFTGRPHDPRNPDTFGDLLRFVAREGLHEACRFCGVLRRDEQVGLIRAADAVIQPSFLEGRGAIVEEASVLGTQVLCADIPVNHELRAPGAVFFDPTDPTELATLMSRRWPAAGRPTAAILDETRGLTADYGRRLYDVFERTLAAGRRAGSPQR